MSDADDQSFDRTKLKKQLTQRKRGKEPSAAAGQAEETKSAGGASAGSSVRSSRQ